MTLVRDGDGAREPQNHDAEPLGHCPKRGQREAMLKEVRVSQRLERRAVHPQRLGRARRAPLEPGREPFEERHQVSSHAITEVVQPVVGRIVTPPLPFTLQKGQYFRSRVFEERPNVVPTTRRDSGEASRPGSTQQAHHDGLGLIARRVTGRDGPPTPFGLEDRVASVPQRGFVPAGGRDGHARKGVPESPREGFHEVAVGSRLRAQTVIDVE